MAAHLITGYKGSEHIQSADARSFNMAMFGGGEFVMEIGEQLDASITNNNTVRILDGDILMQALIAAGASIIVGVLSLCGVIITNRNNNRKIENQLEKAQAVMDCKIDELTREVREHNNFAKRMPVVEEQIKVINRRIEDLERG